MDFRSYVRSRVPALDAQRDPGIIDELAQHLADLYQEARASGLDHDAALARAAAALPDEGQRLARDMRLAARGWTGDAADRCATSLDPFQDHSGGASMLSDLRLDLKYALRTLVRVPSFTLVAVAVLALGIGANATVFSAANAFLLRSLPVSDPDTVVRVCSNRYSATPYRAYLDYRDQTATLAGLAAYQMQSFGMRAGGETEHVFGTVVSGNYFPLLGVAASRGRVLTPADDRVDAPPVAVLSFAFWTRRFGRASDAVGRTITLNDQPFTIVGVAAETFTGTMAPVVGDVWVPVSADRLLRPAFDPAAGTMSVHLVGRLNPGVDRSQAQAELDTIGRRLRQARGEADRGPAVSVYAGTLLHPELSAPVTIFTATLMALVGIVLLIVCVNVANLVLARAAGRDTELAIRQSLGAGRGRLVRQLLTESLLLSLAGAAAGVGLAHWGTGLLTALPLPTPVPIALDLPIDVRVLAFTMLVAVAATLAFGTLPAMSMSRLDLVRVVRGTGGNAVRHTRLRAGFLIAQMAMSVLLLIAAGLFIRSFRNARAVDPGFDAGHVMTASIDLETRGYSPGRGREVIRSLVERLASAPGVAAANAVAVVPVTLSNTTLYLLRDTDAEPAPGEPPPTPQVYTNAVGPGHFTTLQIGMVAGRDFSDADSDGRPDVAIVNEVLARQLWPDQQAVGRRVRLLGGPPTWIEIVGVARDSTYVAIGEAPRPFMYRPLSQAYTPQVTLLVRSAEAPSLVLNTIEREVAAVDRALAIFNTGTLTDAISVSLLPARIASTLLAALGLLALALAALGIYGVLSFLVRSRIRELGIRVALGATPGGLMTMVIRQAMTWTAIGGIAGIALALLMTRFLAGFLYGISPTDMWTFGGVTLLLALVAVVAALVPARRASRLDPLVALRML